MSKTYAQATGRESPKKASIFDSKAKKSNGGFSGVDLADCDPLVMQTFIKTVITAGGALMWGNTSDGGALVLTMFYESERQKIYVTPADDLESVCKEWTEFFQAVITNTGRA